MTAITEFKITKLLKHPVFENLYPEDTGLTIRVLRYIAKETGACHYSLCAAAGITRGQVQTLDAGHHVTPPQYLEADYLGWFVAAVLKRAGFTDADIYPRFFAEVERYRHNRWQRVRLPDLLEDTQATLQQLKEVERLYDYAAEHRLKLTEAYAKYKENLTTPYLKVYHIWRNVFELCSFAGILRRHIKRGTLLLRNPRWVRGEASQETVKVYCMDCKANSPMRLWRIMGKAGDVRTCGLCPNEPMSVLNDRTHYVVNIVEGYRYRTILDAYKGLNVAYQEKPLTLNEFIGKLRKERYVCINHIFLWYKKREVKSLPADGMRRFVELGLPANFRLPEGVFTQQQREHYRRRKRNAKRRTRAIERERRRQEELVTVDKISAYRELMAERAELIRKQTMAADRI